jgi:hypothetical protein
LTELHGPAAFFVAAALAAVLAGCDGGTVMRHPGTLPDLSGLAWISGDEFLGVHDAKDTPEKGDWPRVSLVRLPRSEKDGVLWQPLKVSFPGAAGAASDLESACTLPGGKGFLLCESGQEGDNRRIFHVRLDDGELRVVSWTEWPVAVKNVEATETCEVGGELVFIYAERAEGMPTTTVRWARLSLDPLAFGPFDGLPYETLDPKGPGARPLVALAVDSEGVMYGVSAFDSGHDDGPYRSVVWRIGRVAADAPARPAVVLGPAQRLADVAGFKVESIAVRVLPDGRKQIYIGTDDEHFGGVLRPIP